MDSHRGDFTRIRNTIIRVTSGRSGNIRAGLVVLVVLSGGTLSGFGSEVIPPDYPGGFTVAEVGDAQLTLEPDSTVAIAGIGPDLDDGFVVDMAGRAESGFEIEFDSFMPDRVCFEAFGQLAGGTGTESLGSLDAWRAGDEIWLFVDLSPLGGSDLSGMIMDGGAVTTHVPASAVFPSSPIKFTPEAGDASPQIVRCSFVPEILPGTPGFVLRVAEQVVIDVNGTRMRGDEVRIMANVTTASVAAMETFEVLGAETSHFPGTSWVTSIVGMGPWLTGAEETSVVPNEPFDGDIRISFLSDPDEDYRLERSGDGANWFAVLRTLEGTGGPLAFDDIGAMSAGNFLYRIRATR